MKIRLFLFLLSNLLVQFSDAADPGQKNPTRPFLKTELLFPWDILHNHGSCIVECPNGDLLVCWYRGSGERTADGVAVLGVRKRKGESQWSKPFLMADTPGYPDTNPAMFIDPQKRLWLLWCTILDNRWESALLKYRIATDYQQKSGPPSWKVSEVLHVTPGTNFQKIVSAGIDDLVALRPAGMTPDKFDE